MGDHHQHRQRHHIKRSAQSRQNNGSGGTSIGGLFALAGLAGAVVGIGSVAWNEGSTASIAAKLRPAADGFVRLRPPQPGDSWGGCNDARAVGTAPIYRGEPGYREDMDGDGDGLACEPVS